MAICPRESQNEQTTRKATQTRFWFFLEKLNQLHNAFDFRRIEILQDSFVAITCGCKNPDRAASAKQYFVDAAVVPFQTWSHGAFASLSARRFMDR